MIRSIVQELHWIQWVVVCIGIAIIFGWLFFAIQWLIQMLKKYPLRGVESPDFDWKNPYESETLGLPPGTLRAFLTITILVVVVALLCVSMLVEPIRGTYDEMMVAFEIVLAFYFGSRVVNNVSQNDKEKAASRYKEEKERAVAEAEITTAHAFRVEGAGNVPSDFDVPGAKG